MKIHHLQTASMCPFGGPLVHSKGLWGGLHAHMLCHSLLAETHDGLALIDTGFGIEDLSHPHERIGSAFLTILNLKIRTELTAARQIQNLGYKLSDVRHIIPTHLDLDHAGGMADFPKAKIHIYEDEYLAAMSPQNFNENTRYHPIQWKHLPNWQRYTLEGEAWKGFPSVRALIGDNDDILLVPTVGHTRGHCAIAVKRENDWLLHCGDAYFHHGQMDLDRYHCPLAIEAFQRIEAIDESARAENLDRLRELKRRKHHEVQLFSAHDVEEFENLANRRALV